MDGPRPTRDASPVGTSTSKAGRRRPIQIDAPAGVNLGPTAQRKVVGISGHNLAVCDPQRLFVAARHVSPPAEFYRFYFTARVHQLFFSY
jgi:hypothetical protein